MKKYSRKVVSEKSVKNGTNLDLLPKLGLLFCKTFLGNSLVFSRFGFLLIIIKNILLVRILKKKF